MTTDKGEWLLHQASQSGKTVAQLVPGIVTIALAKLPIAKPMRWGAKRIQFIRPVHTLTLMYGAQLIAAEALGVKSNKQVTGHRFHHQGMVTLEHADDYQDALQQAHVIVDYQQRQKMIAQQIADVAATIDGVALIDQDLLDEVTALVEWPVTLLGSFDASFLDAEVVMDAGFELENLGLKNGKAPAKRTEVGPRYGVFGWLDI